MISIHQVEYQQKSILRNLLELYKYDSSEFDPEDDLNESGLYEYKYLDHYWTEEGRFPFFIRINEKLAGFALIRNIGINNEMQNIYWMAEFFVMKKYRNQKVGLSVAHKKAWLMSAMEIECPDHKWLHLINDTDTNY